MGMPEFIAGGGQPDIPVWHGIYRGVITARNGLNVRAKIPQVLGNEASNWAPPLTSVAAAPAVGALVSVAFMGGDINYPYYLSAGTSGGTGSFTSLNVASLDVTGTLTAPDVSTWSSTGIALASGSNISMTGTSVITADTGWHAFSPLSSSWSLSGGFAQYRKTPMNELQISAQIAAPSSGTVNGMTIATFPGGYRPASVHGFPVFATIANFATASPGMTVTSGGVMQAQGVALNATVYFEVKIPLDI